MRISDWSSDVCSSGLELWEVLKLADHDYLGVQYDVRHAVVEGGRSWVNGLKLIQPHIKTMVVKDFKWVEQGGQWRSVGNHIGEGRSEERRVGEEGVSPCRSRWALGP